MKDSNSPTCPLAVREKYLIDRGWKRHSQNLWVDPRNGSLCSIELAHLHAKERRATNTLLNHHNADRGCRCISLWQPWASLMACGAKHLETRSWNTKVRGRVCIHAAQTRTGILDLHNEACNPHDDTGLKLVVAMEKALDLPFGYWREKLPFGAIIAEGEIYDTATAAEGLARFPDQEPFGDFSPGRFVHLYRDLKPITPIPFKGKQGFFFTRLPTL